MIKLDENYTLIADSLNWVLRYQKVGDINPDTGKPVITKSESYHGNIKFALQNYISEALKPSESAGDMLKKLNEIENNILLLSINLKS